MADAAGMLGLRFNKHSKTVVCVKLPKSLPQVQLMVAAQIIINQHSHSVQRAC
jgi:hypothetical protein